MPDKLDYALRMFDCGLICLPLRQQGKHLDLAAMGYEPVHLRTMRKNLKELAFTGVAFHLAQQPPDRETVARWFDGFAGNVGVLGGHANLLILDFDDPRHFERWSASRDALVQSTPVARSPSGFHVYLRSSGPIISSSLHFGLRRVGHVKALGGYAVASPSVLRAGSQYSWLPGQSPFDVSPAVIVDLASIALQHESPLKVVYDRLLGRGYFQDV